MHAGGSGEQLVCQPFADTGFVYQFGDEVSTDFVSSAGECRLGDS